MAEQVIPLIQKQYQEGLLTKMDVRKIATILLTLINDEDPVSEPSFSQEASSRSSESQSLFDDDNYCVQCGTSMGITNPRQLCGGTFCVHSQSPIFTEGSPDCTIEK